jgi:uncharacterized protein
MASCCRYGALAVLFLLLKTHSCNALTGIHPFLRQHGTRIVCNDPKSTLMFGKGTNQHRSTVGRPQSAQLPLLSAPESSSLENPNEPARPEWALDWMPTWLVTLRPLHQLGVVLAFYVLHVNVLCQRSIAFPFQLIPNDRGYFQSIGLDSVAGILSLVGYATIRKRLALPSLLEPPTPQQAPWRFKTKSVITAKATSVLAFYTLVQGYFFTGRFSLFWEDIFYAAAGVGFPLTIPMHRSLVVLFGHLTWVAMGGLILALIPRPQPFFGGGYKEIPNGQRMARKFKWFTNTWQTYWVWWVLGGYFVSSWFFNIADWVTQMVLPMELFDSVSESVVSQLTNPENNDIPASIVGAIAPCISAPWWEEILYRGYLLPALRCFMPFWPAVVLSGNIFSLTHMSTTGTIPLAVLGWTWAALYAKCGNLFVTILIHCLWNSRVFLASWFGL